MHYLFCVSWWVEIEKPTISLYWRDDVLSAFIPFTVEVFYYNKGNKVTFHHYHGFLNIIDGVIKLRRFSSYNINDLSPTHIRHKIYSTPYKFYDEMRQFDVRSCLRKLNTCSTSWTHQKNPRAVLQTALFLFPESKTQKLYASIPKKVKVIRQNEFETILVLLLSYCVKLQADVIKWNVNPTRNHVMKDLWIRKNCHQYERDEQIVMITGDIREMASA